MAETKKKLTFELKMDRVDKIVELMDSNTLPLNEILKLYSEAQDLIKELEEELTKAKEKVAKYIN
jgi:exodeoxyribonuclease VII small subunit